MEQHSWALDDVFNSSNTLDRSHFFFPPSLTNMDKNSLILNAEQLLTLNQLTAKSYLYFFHFAEQFIIGKTNEVSYQKSTSTEKQAFENFFTEEIKHQLLFRRVMKAIDKALGFNAHTIGIEKQVAKQVLAQSDIAIFLLILHLEVITQDHYVHSIKGETCVDPNIVSVLKHHWLEESQHARLDYLELKELTKRADTKTKSKSIEEYIACLAGLNSSFKAQSESDVLNLEAICGLHFSQQDRISLEQSQCDTYDTLFIKCGLNNAHFTSTVDILFGDTASAFHNGKKSVLSQKSN